MDTVWPDQESVKVFRVLLSTTGQEICIWCESRVASPAIYMRWLRYKKFELVVKGNQKDPKPGLCPTGEKKKFLVQGARVSGTGAEYKNRVPIHRSPHPPLFSVQSGCDDESRILRWGSCGTYISSYSWPTQPNGESTARRKELWLQVYMTSIEKNKKGEKTCAATTKGRRWRGNTGSIITTWPYSPPPPSLVV